MNVGVVCKSLVCVAGVALGVTGVSCAYGAAPAQPPAKLVYPVAQTGDQVDDYHGAKVKDPYRWLEDPDAPKSREWIEAENKVTFGYLGSIPQRDSIRSRLTTVWNYERFGTPGKEGGKYFYSKNDGLQAQSVLYVTDAIKAEARVLLDPNTLSKDGTVALAGTSVSDDARYLAYGTADGGSDWNVWKVREIATGKDLADELKWVKFSGASWMKDGSGFFYSRYDEPKEGQALREQNYYQKVYFHKVGTGQGSDQLVYKRDDQKEWGFGARVTDDGKYLTVTASQGTDPKNRFFVRDLRAVPMGETTQSDVLLNALEPGLQRDRELVAALDRKDTSPASEALRKRLKDREGKRAGILVRAGGVAHGFLELLTDFDASYNFIDNDGPVFWFQTDLKAPRGRVIAIDITKPDRMNWVELIPEAKETLQGVNAVGDLFFCTYLKDAYTQVKVFDLKGTFVREVTFPGIGTAGGFGGKRTDTETFYAYSSYTTPPTVFHYDVKTGESTVFRQAKVDFDPSGYETVQKFYTSKDGTKVPIFITSKKGLTLDGSNPTLLYGYGGFNIPMTPSFSVANLVWLEMGGVYAVACMRGGGEYGEDWHQAGTKLKKQNVFDDFIAGAEFLIREKYTNPNKLAIFGGSNGGLLVGAVVNQRPDLYAAAIPAVGVMDMLRFHKFTIGWAWTSDYGCSDNADEFKALYAYSPIHNIKPGTKYPAVLVTTGDHDDRVVPAHSFKYAATLQAAQAGDRPVLIRIETRAGHGAGKPTAKIIEEAADRWAFLVRELGMEKK